MVIELEFVAELERTQEKDEMAVENIEHIREVEKRVRRMLWGEQRY